MANEILRLEDISKSYSTSQGPLNILEGLNLTVSEGEICAIVGQSGSGKSTLLATAALLLKKDSGKIYYNSNDTDGMDAKQIEKLRRSSMGFVFQSSLLLEDFSALENIALPLMIQGKREKEAMEEAKYYLELVDLYERKEHRPDKLSGGERQRIAIARALAPKPDIIFADEPTGALDEMSADKVSGILFDVIKKEKRGMLLVTHNNALAAQADKVYVLKGGKLESR